MKIIPLKSGLGPKLSDVSEWHGNRLFHSSGMKLGYIYKTNRGQWIGKLSIGDRRESYMPLDNPHAAKLSVKGMLMQWRQRALQDNFVIKNDDESRYWDW